LLNCRKADVHRLVVQCTDAEVLQRCTGAYHIWRFYVLLICQVQSRCKHAEVLSGCRGEEVKSCRVTEVQSCRVAKEVQMQRCRDAEMQRCRCRDAEVQSCTGADMEVLRCCVGAQSCTYTEVMRY
jgi:hypothetical protein